MITDVQKDLLLTQYYDRGILKKEIRSYEVSLWTLQDDFITVLKWSDAEHKGRIEEPKMTLNIDGTLKFTFSVPMYYHVEDKLIENSNWYTIQNDKLLLGMRKVKVIFNKLPEIVNPDDVFEFVIINVSENHEKEILTCEIEAEGLAFQELGKIGYKLSLSLDRFELDYASWQEKGYWINRNNDRIYDKPVANIDYWCYECCRLEILPLYANALLESRIWYYDIQMNWKSFEEGSFESDDTSIRSPQKIYEESYVSSWNDDLTPKNITKYREKERIVDAENSNLYNITLTIAETFGVHCRYKYTYDENYHINGRIIIFYNNFMQEEAKPFSLTYPYSASKTERIIDSENITSKLYVLDVNNDSILEGYTRIANAPSNASGEDYILNFDYLHDIGAISNELYDAIVDYEKEMRQYNSSLMTLQQLKNTYESLIIDIKAKRAIAEKSIILDEEQITNNSDLANKLDKKDGAADGYIELTGANCDSFLVLTDELNRQYLNLQSTNKGIDMKTFKLYKTLDNKELKEEIKKFLVSYDEYNNVKAVYLDESTIKDSEGKLAYRLYASYKYKPQLYYDNIIKVWKIKLAKDIADKIKYNKQLGPNGANDSTFDTTDYPAGVTPALIYNTDNPTDWEVGLYRKFYDLESIVNEKIRAKNDAMHEFERFMGPAMREGYWQPDDYSDYGDMYELNNQTIYAGISTSYINKNVYNSALIAWDPTLFDDEATLYYEIGVNKDIEFYPCLDLTSIFFNEDTGLVEIPTDLDKYCLVWQTTNTAVNDTNISDFQYFAVGSNAVIKFLRVSSNSSSSDIRPVLMLTGTKAFSGDLLAHLILPQKTSTKLEQYSVKVDDNGEIVESHGPVEKRHIIKAADWLFYRSGARPDDWNTDETRSLWNFMLSATISNRYLVYPRIKFSSLLLKTDTTNLYIKYNGYRLLEGYDYYINTRDTERDGVYYLEYYITIKPESIIKYGGLDKTYDLIYVLSNANTAMYLDALEVSKENAYPKVSYEVSPGLLNVTLMSNLYSVLAHLVMINDVDLKFEEVFGYVSEVNLDLDKPWEDQLEIKNYTTKFEDLFATIVASSESMRKNDSKLSTALDGGIALSDKGLNSTLIEQGDILNAYLDAYFDGSDVVKHKLMSLFTEASLIISGANKTANKLQALSVENAEILAGFAENIAQSLSIEVYRLASPPTHFKTGDIWVKDANTIYVATCNSSELTGTSTLGSSGDFTMRGWVRTYDGTLSSITGAALDVDAVAGEIKIEAENAIKARTNGYLLLEGNDVDIVGQLNVNISGPSINIVSNTRGSLDYSTGGINLIATTMNDIEDNSISKVLILPNIIEMGAAELKLKSSSEINIISSGGEINNTAAVHISSKDGVWIGTGVNSADSYGVRIFSGDIQLDEDGDIDMTPTEINGASIELNKDHLILGFANTGINKKNDDSANAIELDKDQIVISSGKGFNSGKTSITGNANTLVGAIFKKDSIGFATLYVDNGTTKYNAILMQDDAVTIGSGSLNVTLPTGTGASGETGTLRSSVNGSYVRIASSGIDIGSLANLYINTNNFKLLTDTYEINNSGTKVQKRNLDNTLVAIGTNLNALRADSAVDPSDGIVKQVIVNSSNVITGYTAYSTTPTLKLLLNLYGLYINGAVYANLFLATSERGKFIANGTSLGLYLLNNDPILTVSIVDNIPQIVSSRKLYMEASSGILIVTGATINIDSTNFKVKSNPDYEERYFYVGNNTNYIEYMRGADELSPSILTVKGNLTANTLTVGSGDNLLTYANGVLTVLGDIIGNTLTVGTGNNLLTYVDSTLTVKGDITATTLSVGSGDNLLTYINGVLTVKGNITANTISAIDGSIGGWTISEHGLSSGGGTTTVYLDSKSTNSYAIWAGASEATSAPFAVKRDGSVYIKSLIVDGESIDFSSFENAVSLKSGGSWSGSTFTATVSLWGKINRSIELEANVYVSEVTAGGLLMGAGIRLGSVKLTHTVNGSDDPVTTYNDIPVKSTAIYNDGYTLAASEVQYTDGANSFLAPNLTSYQGDKRTISLLPTYYNGWNSLLASIGMSSGGDIYTGGYGYSNLYVREGEEGSYTYTSVGSGRTGLTRHTVSPRSVSE